MKSITFIIMSLLFICIGCTSQIDRSAVVNYEEQTIGLESNSILHGIQAKIDQAFMKSIPSNSDASLVALASQLEKEYTTKSEPIIQYWRAYLSFYQSIYYLETGSKEKSEKVLNQGMQLLEDIPSKNSEDYALLSMMQGFNLQFQGMNAMFMARAVNKNIMYALSLEEDNIRANYVYASNDYYTPEMYGGGQEVETYLLKALSLEEQKEVSDILPSWGKEEAYELLIKHYIRKENWVSAMKHYKEGIGLYPDSYGIKQLASQLEK